MIHNRSRRKSISKMTQQGRAAEGKECSGRSPPSSGSDAIGDMAIVIALFLCAHGQRSGVRYAFLGLLDVVFDSNDDRGPGGNVRVAGMFLPNLRALSGLLGDCSCSAITKKHAAPRNRGAGSTPEAELRRVRRCLVRTCHAGLETARLVLCVVCEWLARPSLNP